jgi:hypothetical protein
VLVGVCNASEIEISKSDIFIQDLVERLATPDYQTRQFKNLEGIGSSSCSFSNYSPINPFGAYRIDFKEAFKRWECDMIFSDTTPDWANSSDRTWWWPVCSAVTVQSDVTENGLTYPAAFQAHVERMLKRDLCSAPRGEDRFVSGHVAPSQNAEGVTVMPENERVAFSKQIRAFVNQQFTSECCSAKDELCQKLLKKVEITWCKPASDPNSPDPCTDVGANYNFSPAEADKLILWFQDKKKSFEKFPFSPGRISMTSFVKADNQLLHNMGVFAHELGHACSSIRMQLAIQRRKLPAQISFLQAINRVSCDISDLSKKSYQEMLAALGATAGTSKCLIDYASKAASSRFTNQPCENGCPISHLEESTADWLRVKSLADNQWYPNVIPTMCQYLRDAMHPLGADEMSCFMLTPAFKEKMRRNFGCIPSKK